MSGKNYEIFNLVEQNERGQGPANWRRMLKIGEESGKSEWQDSLSAATSLLDRLNRDKLKRRYSAAEKDLNFFVQ